MFVFLRFFSRRMADSIFILTLHTFLPVGGEGCKRAFLKDFDVQKLCMTKAKVFKCNTTHYIATLLTCLYFVDARKIQLFFMACWYVPIIV